MNVTLLAISIGNTRTRLGVFAEGKLTETAALENNDAQALVARLDAALQALKDAGGGPVVLASVNPPLAERLVAELAARQDAPKMHRVGQDMSIPIGRQLDPEALVGDDRLLNAAAAYGALKQACVVIDAGTAMTIDFVDGAGTFHGGAIAPGLQLMLDSLHAHTAQLPPVSMAAPQEPIGHNTVEAMRSAAFHGSRGLARELVEKYAEVAGAYPLVVATGGNAELLFKDYDLVERIVPDLTLLGIAQTLQAAVDDEA